MEPLEATASKLEQTRILADFFKEIKGQRLQPYIYLSLGQLGPVYANPQTNFGLALSLIHISEPTRLLSISYAVFCLEKKPSDTRLWAPAYFLRFDPDHASDRV